MTRWTRMIKALPLALLAAALSVSSARADKYARSDGRSYENERRQTPQNLKENRPFIDKQFKQARTSRMAAKKILNQARTWQDLDKATGHLKTAVEATKWAAKGHHQHQSTLGGSKAAGEALPALKAEYLRTLIATAEKKTEEDLRFQDFKSFDYRPAFWMAKRAFERAKRWNMPGLQKGALAAMKKALQVPVKGLRRLVTEMPGHNRPNAVIKKVSTVLEWTTTLKGSVANMTRALTDLATPPEIEELVRDTFSEAHHSLLAPGKEHEALKEAAGYYGLNPHLLEGEGPERGLSLDGLIKAQAPTPWRNPLPAEDQ